jgi:Xaa-Pro dipeptidase
MTPYVKRQTKLQKELQGAGISCAVVMPGPNLRYLTGLQMKPSERMTLTFFPMNGAEIPALLLPLLEKRQAEARLTFKARVYAYEDREGPQKALAQLVRDLALAGQRLGIEYQQMRTLELRSLEAAVNKCSTVPLEGPLAQLRATKDATEIEAMKRAIALSEVALGKTIEAIRPGRTEQEISRYFQRELLEAGTEGPPFTPIVVSGPNGGSPHALPSERRLAAGDLITFDVGVAWEGYAGDITRCVALGKLDPELEKIYQIVCEANTAGREACKPDAPAEEVDRAARQVIERAGYGKFFIHRTGHGLGLEVHEPPYIVEGNAQELQPGMTFTVEPGIYLPGRGGARVEDDMLMTTDGAETLTHFSRELIRL